MRVIVNGEPREVAAPALADLVRGLGLDPGKAGVAVAVNGEVVRRTDWGEVVLREGDRVEVVAATQGG